MNNKPFWQGKTCKEMAGLHVKVTFNSGTIVTGVTNVNGDIPEADNLSGREGNEKFVPYDYVKSIELLDDPEYERIDNIEDVRKGDEVFTLSGNKYKARAVYESMEVYADGDGFIPITQRKYFAYALRPKPKQKPKLPDHGGLWVDKNGGHWVVDATVNCMQLVEDSLGWMVDGVCCQVNDRIACNRAPFRPAKAVEA